MKNLKSIFLLAIMLIACQTVFAQTDEGIEYYNNKDYTNAVKCFQQAAEQGDGNSSIQAQQLLLHKPNGYLRILNAGYNLHLRYPSVVYVRNGRVSALMW